MSSSAGTGPAYPAARHRTVLLGLRPGQVVWAALVVGVSLAVATSTELPAIGLVGAAVGLVGAVVPIRGYCADRWVSTSWWGIGERWRGRRAPDGPTPEPCGEGAVLIDGARRTVVMACGEVDLLLVDPAEQQRRLAALVRALEVLGGALGSAGTLQLVVELTGPGGRSRGYLAITTGGRRAREAAPAILEIATLAKTVLVDAGLTLGPVLGPESLAELLAVARVAGAPLGRTAIVAGAMVHATWWISGWPSRPVEAGFLSPLLLSGLDATLALCIEPLDSHAALRRIEQAQTSAGATVEQRRRGGYRASARAARAQADRDAHELALAAGQHAVELRGYLRARGRDLAELKRVASALEVAASRAGLELEPMAGRQRQGLWSTVPAGGRTW